MMASTTSSSHLAADEGHALISSEKVDGTTVYNAQGERLGSIHHLMIGKQDGRVRYAVLSFGGLFGIGSHYHPLPWDVLTYDTEKAGYVVDVDRDLLEKAPSYHPDDEPSWSSGYHQEVHDHWGKNQGPFDPGIRGVADDYRS